MGYRIDYSLNPVAVSGALAPFAKCYVYADGTTTPLTIYSDEACGSTAVNPVVADASGVLPPRYVSTTAQMTLAYKTSADVAISSHNDQNPVVSGSGFFSTSNNLSEGVPATMRTNLELGDVALVDKDTVSEDSAPAGATDFLLGIDISAGEWKKVKHNNVRPLEILMGGIALSDESTALTAGAAKVTVHLPYAFTIVSVFAGLSTVSSSGAVQIDINEAGASIFSTALTIDANEETSATAATAAVLSDTSLAQYAKLTFDIDSEGTGAKGAKVYIVGYRT